MKNDGIEAILGNTALWQTDLSDMSEKVSEYYGRIEAVGAKEAMKWIMSE